MPYNVCIEAETSGIGVQPAASASGGQYSGTFGNPSELADFVFTAVTAGNYLVRVLYAQNSPSTNSASLSVDGGAPIPIVTMNTGGWTTFVNADTNIGALTAGSHTIRFAGVNGANLDKICLIEIVAPTPPPTAPPTAPTPPPTAPPTAPPVAPTPPVLIEFWLKPKSETPERDECTGACFTTICFEKKPGQVVGAINNALLYKLPNQTTPVDAKVFIGAQVCYKILNPQVGDRYMVKIQTY